MLQEYHSCKHNVYLLFLLVGEKVQSGLFGFVSLPWKKKTWDEDSAKDKAIAWQSQILYSVDLQFYLASDRFQFSVPSKKKSLML